MLTKGGLLRSAALAAITASTAKSVPVLAQASADRPGFLKAKDIAEAGFIYGLPIVMGYGVMYEFAVDRSSGQFKAPFNQIANAANVFTYKDTAVVTPHADIPSGAVAAGECLLVADHVRRQVAVADRKPDQSRSDQLADAGDHEDKCRRVAHAPYPEQIARR